MEKLYDTIVIGAGIAGASIAYRLHQKEEHLLVLDKKGIASGGSGAAGAFVSPKIGKGSPLQTLTNEAFDYAQAFYHTYAREYFHQTGVVRIPKDEEDAQKFVTYENYLQAPYERYSTSKLQRLGITSAYEALFFPQAGDCDAVGMCRFLLQGIDVAIYNATKIYQKEGMWHIGAYRAKKIVIASGYEHTLVDMDYMGLRGTWGTRADFSSNLALRCSMHQSLSVGANHQGVIKVGATHEKCVKTPQPCQAKEAIALKQKASTLVNVSDFTLKKSFCGMRAGSKDYFPLVGRVIDVTSMLQKTPKIRQGATPKLTYIPNLYILGGFGGRGFVFAPLMAQHLAQYMVDKTPLDARTNPDRLFFKWARKLKNQPTSPTVSS